jgi:hypothetical protein
VTTGTNAVVEADAEKQPLVADESVLQPAAAQPERAPLSAVAPAALAGLAAAAVAGVVWGLIVKSTDYEIGIAAWGVGLLAGWGVHLAAGRRIRPELAVVAVVAALLGILLGKYLSFVFVVRDEGSKLGIDVPLFSSRTWNLFWDSKSDVFSFFDVIWIGLAVVTAPRVAMASYGRRRTATV